MRRARRKQNNDVKHLILLIILVLVFSGLGYNLDYKIDESKIWETEEVNIYDSNDGVVDPNLKIHYVDQTTPNMIQGLKGIFARKPLISRGI